MTSEGIILSDIDRSPLVSDATVTIYAGGKCVLSAEACRLIGISREGRRRVRFRSDILQERVGRKRIYVSSSAGPVGYVVHFHKGRNTAQIHSATLARSLAKSLSGYGTYRICEEVVVHDGEDTGYEVFFRKYQKKG